MPLPELRIGLVVRYEYLWKRRQDAPNADKERPACVVVTYRMPDPEPGTEDDRYVVYLPVSHTPPSGEQVGIELAEHAKRMAGLDPERQWVLVSECNIDIWPHDLRPLPGQPGRFHYGHLPPGEFRRVREAFTGYVRSRKLSKVYRP